MEFHVEMGLTIAFFLRFLAEMLRRKISFSFSCFAPKVGIRGKH